MHSEALLDFLQEKQDDVDLVHFNEIKIGDIFYALKPHQAFMIRIASNENKAVDISSNQRGAFYYFDDTDMVMTIPNFYEDLAIKVEEAEE